MLLIGVLYFPRLLPCAYLDPKGKLGGYFHDCTTQIYTYHYSLQTTDLMFWVPSTPVLRSFLSRTHGWLSTKSPLVYPKLGALVWTSRKTIRYQNGQDRGWVFHLFKRNNLRPEASVFQCFFLHPLVYRAQCFALVQCLLPRARSIFSRSWVKSHPKPNINVTVLCFLTV